MLQSIIVKVFEKIIFWLFCVLLFLVPLILWPYTSEVFEFNKMVLVYVLTTLITGTWIINMIVEKKFIFRRTILDIPLLVFMGTQLISSLLSIDPLTSWLGYYSRFNGGMLSVICYSLLYWAFVNYFDSKKTIKLINVTLASATLVSVYGVLEHYGIDKHIWVQDVQSRIFSTLGQPNWLAAWLTGLIPITWALMVIPKQESASKKFFQSKNFWVYFLLSVLFFWTLIFSKSRSGFAGFGVTFLLFWTGYFWTKRKEVIKNLVSFSIISFSLLIVCLISGTQWTPSVAALIAKTTSTQIPVAPSGSTALETGGTESGSIRKIVWKGALQVWLHYPIFGSGVETFAYSYYMYRPAEHNSTSEWDFIYNKAHNEFLNILANSGTIGFLSYLILIGYIFFVFIKKFNGKLIVLALAAGFTSILITNFFGFSVVPIQLQFFLFPAFALALARTEEEEKKKNDRIFVSGNQKYAIAAITIFALYLSFLACRYWYADYVYATGKGYNSVDKPDVASIYFAQAVKLEPNQPIYHSDLSSSYARVAVALNQQKQPEQAKQYTELAITEINKASTLSPANINLKRTRFAIFVILSAINPNYLLDARDTLIAAIAQAPTDAKLYYNLGLAYARTGQMDLARETLKKTVELRPKYKEARLAYSFLLIDVKENTEARAQLEYILKYIDPIDSLSKQTLESIK